MKVSEYITKNAYNDCKLLALSIAPIRFITASNSAAFSDVGILRLHTFYSGTF